MPPLAASLTAEIARSSLSGARASATSPPAPDPATEARLGNWKLLQKISETTWSQVFLATPADAARETSGDYVVKRIKSEYESDPLAVEMFRRESYLGQRVSHPHVTCVLASHVRKPPYYLVVPYHRGVNLRELLMNQGRLEVSQALWIARQVAEGLVAIHEAGWLHGDIKPENVLVGANGHATVADLGLARRFVDVEHGMQVLGGSLAYLAPECLGSSTPVTGAADTYALGIMLFEMLAGKRPFASVSACELATAHHQEVPPNPRRVVPHLAPGIGRLLRRMLRKEPLRRPVDLELVNLLVDLEIDSLGVLAEAA